MQSFAVTKAKKHIFALTSVHIVKRADVFLKLLHVFHKGFNAGDFCAVRFLVVDNPFFASEYARKLLSLANAMQKEVQDFYRTHTNIMIASCAPCDLLFKIRDIVKECFNDIKCETVVENEEEMKQKLLDGTYSFAIFSQAQGNKAFVDFPLKTEHLFAMIPETHALASKKGITFSEINGEAVVPFPLKGHWSTLLEQKLLDSQFLYQANIEAFDKVINSSNLISFASDMLPIDIPHHKSIPILDSEATITYHLAVLKANQEQFQDIIQRLKVCDL